MLRVLRLLRILKLSKYNSALQDLFHAVMSEKKAFTSALFLLLIAIQQVFRDIGVAIIVSLLVLEANGIATVVMGCAKDIVEHAAAPRFLFSDFPLGNSAGKPHDEASQALTLELALRAWHGRAALC